MAKKEYWQQKWESDDIGFNQSQPNQLLQRYFNIAHSKLGDHIFVPLCGKSIDMIWLVNQGYNVVGVELSTIACEAFYQENNIPVSMTRTDDFTVYRSDKITLYAGDFFKLSKEMLGRIDVVYDRAALIALPAELRQRYAAYLLKLIDLDTVIFLITTVYNQNEMTGPPFSVDDKEVATLYSNRFKVKQIYNKPVQVIPSHLQARGLVTAHEQVYYLSHNGFGSKADCA